MKIFIPLVLLVVLGVGGFFAYNTFFKSSPSPVAVESEQSGSEKKISCLEGVNGNSGDNYCSNTHSTSSKCQPGFENNYPDGCTQ